MGVRKMKAQLSAMEGRVGSLEEQLDVATRWVGRGRGYLADYVCVYVCACVCALARVCVCVSPC